MATDSPSSRPATPGRTPPPPPTESLPAIPEGAPKAPPTPRRSSFSFLRRSKSGEPMSRRSTSGSKLSKKQQQQELLRQQQEAAAAASSMTPPTLPNLSPPPPIKSFGGDDARPDSVAIMSNNVSPRYPRGLMDPTPPTAPPSIPIPPIPGTFPKMRSEDGMSPLGQSESMAHRGRYSYASSMVSTVNSPRRVRRRRDPTPFNILVVGARNSGKTSFLNFLRTSLTLPHKRRGQAKGGEEPQRGGGGGGGGAGPLGTQGIHPTYTSQYLETEIEGERVGLTLWESQGLDKTIVDLQIREMIFFLESKFEETFAEEMKVIRAPGVQDTHIHCVFLVLDPVRLDGNIAEARRRMERQPNGAHGKITPETVVGALDDDLDLQVLRALQGKTTVVPVISKADTITTAHMRFLKKTVWDNLKRGRIELLEGIGVEEFSEANGDSAIVDDDDEDDDMETKKENGHTHGDDDDDGDDDSSSGSVIVKPTAAAARTNNNNHHHPTNTTPPLPLSILSPDMYEPGTIGRRFPWGFADPNDPHHCDFLRLKESVFADWRADLREASREIWYERWRTNRLGGR